MTPVVMTWVVKRLGVFAANLTGKQELDVIGPPEVEIVANDRLEKFAPPQGPVEDLRETDFRLENRELIGKPARGMRGRQRAGESAACHRAKNARLAAASERIAHALQDWRAREQVRKPLSSAVKRMRRAASCRFAHSCPLRQILMAYGA